MTSFMCTYAVDRENLVVFDFSTEINDMEEAIGHALYRISADEPEVDLAALAAFSVLRLE